jgi:antitoxin ParD1/3/4
MEQARRLNVALPSEQVDALKEAVAAGEYATTSEIVREAVRDWQLKRAMRPEEIAHLRQLWDEGKASGPAGPLDFDDLRREARGRLAAGDASDG